MMNNSSNSMREIIITSVSYGFDQKNHFFKEWSWFKIVTIYGLKSLHQCVEKIKTKSQKVLGANSNVCRSYKEKIAGGFLPLPIPS